jgi:hypothetical protein
LDTTPARGGAVDTGNVETPTDLRVVVTRVVDGHRVAVGQGRRECGGEGATRGFGVLIRPGALSDDVVGVVFGVFLLRAFVGGPISPVVVNRRSEQHGA